MKAGEVGAARGRIGPSSLSEGRAARYAGDGDKSSSDGQCSARRTGEARADDSAKYGSEPGVKVYTHVSDRYGPFYFKVIAANASEADAFPPSIQTATAYPGLPRMCELGLFELRVRLIVGGRSTAPDHWGRLPAVMTVSLTAT